MNNEKRLFLAIALSIIVILSYQGYMRKQPAASKGMPQRVVQQVDTAIDKSHEPVNQTVSPLYKEPTDESLAVFENDTYKIVFSNHGAGIKELYMKREGLDQKGDILMAEAHKNAPAILATENALSGSSIDLWSQKQMDSNSITYELMRDGTKTTKEYVFHNNSYVIELQQTIENTSSRKVEQKIKIAGGQVALSGTQMDDMHIGADVKIGSKIYRNKPNSKKEHYSKLFQGAPEWVSTRSRYFAFILKPGQQEEGAFVENVDKKVAWSGLVSGPFTLEPMEKKVAVYSIYAGPNNPATMAPMAIPPKEIVGYWATSGIAKLLLKSIRFFYGITNSYGLSIIILTIILSSILLPLTRKSMQSMKEMQKIQPEVEKIKKEGSSNPQKMNKEIMELYREHNVNPMGGCLPMFLQFPIFVSLFQALPRSIELKDAHFLWIKDLSSPDALFTLSRTFPVIQDKVNLLPVLMAIAMAVQQKVSHPGGEVSEQQRMMAVMMPVLFGFIFYNMASALVLYWLTNTLFTLVMQEIVLKARQKA